MAQLPGQDAIAPLPDKLPRRMGVGGWQPRELEQGAQTFAHGFESAGMDLGLYGGEISQQDKQLATAKANSAMQVGLINTENDLRKETDPNAVQQNNYPDRFNQVAANAAKFFPEGPQRDNWLTEQAPTLAKANIAVGDHIHGLNTQNEVAGLGQAETDTINGALSTQDDNQRNSLISSYGARLDAAVAKGYITPEQRQQRSLEFAHNYSYAQLRIAIARADQTGDTSELKRLLPYYQMQPGISGGGISDWSAPPASAAELRQRATAVTGSLVTHFGASPIGAAAITGNGIRESSLRTTAGNWDNEDSHGQFQWNGERWTQAQAWAKANGQDINDPATQLAYAKFESSQMMMPDGRTSVWDAVNRAGSVKEASDIWMRYFEKPKDQGPDESTKRANYSQTAFQAYSNGGSGAFVGLSPPAAVTTQGAGPPDQTNFNVANSTLKMTQQEQALYQRHLTNLYGPGGVDNADGSRSSLFQTSVDIGGKTYNIPTVWDGKILPPKDALARAKAEGIEKFPAYADVATAESRYQEMHRFMEQDTEAFQKRRGARPAPGQEKPLPIDQTGAAGPGRDLIPLGGQPIDLGAKADSINPKRPDGVDHVANARDGSLVYVMKDGSTQPVPGSRATGAPGAFAPGKTGTILDALKPDEKAELGVQLQNAVATIERRNSEGQKQESTDAKAALKSATSDLIKGQPVGQDTADDYKNRYSAHQDPEVRQRYAEFAATRNAINSFRGLSPAQVQANVDNMEAEYVKQVQTQPNSSDTDAKAAALDASQKWLKSYQGEIAKNAFGRAVKDGVLPGVKALDPNSQTIVGDMRQRAADAEKVANFYGLGEPQYLQPQEKAQFRQIARNGGQPMINLASSVVAGMGSQAGSVFKEIGADAPAFAGMGRLALQGGDPGAIDDIAQVTAALHDKSIKSDVPRFNESILGQGRQDPLGNASQALGDIYTSQTREMANLLMSAKAYRDGRDPKADKSFVDNTFIDTAYQKALGATQDKDGNWYGGVIDRGGYWAGNQQKVLVPPDVRANKFDDVINKITDRDLSQLPNPPRGNFKAVDLKEAWLRAVPDQQDGLFHGDYAVYLHDPNGENPKPVFGQNGKQWILQFDQVRSMMGDRAGDAFLKPKASPQRTPATTPGQLLEAGEPAPQTAEAE
jgi:hypothetical protein